MEQKVLDLFTSNYENKGLCQNLPKFVKVIEKEFKKSGVVKKIDYLPWATVERIFRMQGGKVEVVDWRYGVEFAEKGYNEITGVIDDTTKEALFVHLKGTWQGVELDEFYPIFDNQTSKVVKSPDAQQLNLSRQRGSVRLIARLSGIGLWIFEQQDNQWDDDSDSKEPIVIPTKIGSDKEPKDIESTQRKRAEKTKKAELNKAEKDDAMKEILGETPEKNETEETVEIVEDAVEDDGNVANMFLGNIVGAEPTPTKKEPKVAPKPEIQTTFANGSEEHADALLKIKGFIKTHKDTILEFRNSKGKERLGDLTYNELQELLEQLI